MKGFQTISPLTIDIYEVVAVMLNGNASVVYTHNHAITVTFAVAQDVISRVSAAVPAFDLNSSSPPDICCELLSP